eukprot:2235332-Alexandrium_andersonii.AAC.1
MSSLPHPSSASPIIPNSQSYLLAPLVHPLADSRPPIQGTPSSFMVICYRALKPSSLRAQVMYSH